MDFFLICNLAEWNDNSCTDVRFLLFGSVPSGLPFHYPQAHSGMGSSGILCLSAGLSVV